MTQDLFKWEDGGTLKHHCPICQTPLSHDKCRTTCLGTHVEWCHRYHSLFRKNWSSRCAACKTTDEQHEKRHREVAEILARIKKLKQEEEAAAMELSRSPAGPKTPRTPLTAKALNTVDGRSALPLDTQKVSKKERKAAKKVAKALDRDKVVCTADIKFVATTLHPRGDKPEDVDDAEMGGLSEDLDIKMNLKFSNHTCNSKSARHDFIIKDREQLKMDDLETDRLFDAFDVDKHAEGKAAELVIELTEAIRNDFMHCNDELNIVARNRAGFWRWANKRVYRDLVENGKHWDDKHKPYHPAERRDSAISAEADTEDDTSASRHGSLDSSSADSAGTSLTVPSTKSPASKKTAPVLRLSTPLAKKMTFEGEGWSRVGKKIVKAPVGNLTLSSNGGLHHFQPKPRGTWGALEDSKHDDDQDSD
ncbi:hypothetical protein DOTSEDRAFT_55815 [Dothistroma septosporum NZE10]|uniref:Uncharacterized protein n=1 Tax=Dothistroma septosporum (strain NZE10 / CBS 128990) TaxID=675120 RepID=N1PDJ7_DOTSN|nr:hypothetical protein DOTSEDRAFT_55815 [Dothistroma septosporum NZE10]